MYFAPIVTISDEMIWKHLVTPQTKALLGKITGNTEPHLFETLEGHFPGDNVTNLNNHGLFGCQDSYVRFPYCSVMYTTEYGALVVKKSFEKIKVMGWYGDVRRANPELIYQVAMRDRRDDGTKRTNDCSLLDFPLDDPAYNRPLPGGLTSLEVSIYGFMPNSRIASASGDTELENFVAQPFACLHDETKGPSYFLEQLKKIWRSNRGPGMVAGPIPDVSRFINIGWDAIGKFKKYDFLENAPSHYHVTRFSESIGYRITYLEHVEALRQIREGLQRIKDAGVSLTRVQESWVCILQSLPRDMIDDKYYLGGVTWPQDNLSQDTLWMNKPLSAAAKSVMSECIGRGELASEKP
jgi:hypothetical protein